MRRGKVGIAPWAAIYIASVDHTSRRDGAISIIGLKIHFVLQVTDIEVAGWRGKGRGRITAHCNKSIGAVRQSRHSNGISSIGSDRDRVYWTD